MNLKKQPPSTSPEQRWGKRSLLPWMGALILGPLLGGGATGVHWSWRYIQHDLVPQISEDLSRSLNRPVELGAVEGWTLGGLQLGASAIPAIATDTDTLALDGVHIRVQPFASLRHGKVQLVVTLLHPQVEIRQEADGDWVATEIDLDDDTALEVHQIRVRNGTVRILPHPSFTADATPLEFHHLNGNVTLLNEGEQLRLELAGRSPDSGNFRVNGEMDLSTEIGQIRLRGQDVAIAPLARLLPPEIWIQSGKLNANVRAKLHPNHPPALEGVAELRDFSARAEGEPNPFTETRGRFRFQDQTIAIEEGFVKFGRIPFQVGGSIHLQQGLNLEANVASLSVQDFMANFKLKLPFPATGALKTDNLRVKGPFGHAKFSGTVTNATPITLDRVQVNARTDFVLDKTDDHLSLINLQVFPKAGGQITTHAEIDLKDEGSDVALTAEAKGIAADAIATLYNLPTDTVTLGTLNATATVAVSNDTPQVEMDWQLTEGQYPAQGQLRVDDDRLALQNVQVAIGTGKLQGAATYGSDRWQLQLAGSAIPLRTIQPALPGVLTGNLTLAGTDITLDAVEGRGSATLQLADGSVDATMHVGDRQWHGDVTTTRLPLRQFAADLPGILQGSATVGGDLAQLTPNGIRTTGQVQLVDILPQWRSPLRATFQWDGRTLTVLQRGSDGLQANASLNPRFDGWELTDLGPLNGRIQIQDYDLQNLPFELPDALHLAGRVNLDAALQGSIAQPQILGELQLNGLAVNQLAFAPTLQGPVQWDKAQGVNVSLAGDRNRLTLQAQGDRRQFSLHHPDAVAEGLWEGDRLTAQIQDLEIAAFLPLADLPEPVKDLQGKLSGNITANVPRRTLLGTFVLDRPRLGPLGNELEERHGSDRLTAQVDYQNGLLRIPQGQFAFGQSRYQFTGTFQPASQNLAATLTSERSDVQDMLTLAQWVHPTATTMTAPVQSFLDTLPIATNLPATESTALAGYLTGSVTVNHQLPTGLAIAFDLNGQNWQIGTLGIQQLTLRGHHTLPEPLAFETLALDGLHYNLVGTSEPLGRRLQFSGSLNPQQMDGKLELLDVSLPLLSQLFQLPVALDGEMSAIASLNGSLANPSLDGTLHLSDIQAPLLTIEQADIGFTYQNTQFQLNSWTEPHPTPNP